MEEYTCPSGRVVQLNLNRTTLRMAFGNPYLPVVEKLYESYLELKDNTAEEDFEKKAGAYFDGFAKTMDYFEAVDRVVSIVCADPHFYLPEDEDVPEGAALISELKDIDAFAIFQFAMGYLGEFRKMLPFRSGAGGPEPGQDV
jgi:hypothetical protein